MVKKKLLEEYAIATIISIGRISHTFDFQLQCFTVIAVVDY